MGRRGASLHTEVNSYDIMAIMNTERTRSVDNQFKVITPVDMKPRPDAYEEEVARILARKFQSDILFVPPINSLHAPDLQVVRDGKFWEIKNIRGNAKNTIEDNLKKAAKQSENVVISLLRTKMTPVQAAARIRHNLSRSHGNIKNVILITKGGKTLDFHG